MSDSFATSWTGSPPGSSVHGISQARLRSGFALPSPGDLPNPGTKLMSPELVGGFFTTEPPGKSNICLSSETYFKNIPTMAFHKYCLFVIFKDTYISISNSSLPKILGKPLSESNQSKTRCKGFTDVYSLKF